MNGVSRITAAWRVGLQHVSHGGGDSSSIVVEEAEAMFLYLAAEEIAGSCHQLLA